MYEDKSAFYKVLNYLEDKGFYIILTLCIVSIGISGYVFFFSDIGGKKSEQPDDLYLSEIPLQTSGENNEKSAVGDAKISSDDKKSINSSDTPEISNTKSSEEKINIPSADIYDVIPDDSAAEAVKNQQITATQPTTSQTVPKENKETAKYVRPVSGKVIHSFSGQELEYSPTMDDWRSHNGTDFEASMGEKVKSVCAGTVEDIYQDEVFGTCIVIAHENDEKTVYTGLMQQTSVQSGDKVDAGTIIGGVGDTALIEAAESTRLHVEYIKDGKYQNIEKLLPQS